MGSRGASSGRSSGGAAAVQLAMPKNSETFDVNVGQMAYNIVASPWSNYGKNRIYIEDHTNPRYKQKIGYYDFDSKKFVFPKKDTTSQTYLDGIESNVMRMMRKK